MRKPSFMILVATLAAISPLTLDSSGRISASEACADGTCCWEDKSMCFINDIRTDDAFYRGSGSCLQPH
jgi:hypothetical protein